MNVINNRLPKQVKTEQEWLSYNIKIIRIIYLVFIKSNLKGGSFVSLINTYYLVLSIAFWAYEVVTTES